MSCNYSRPQCQSFAANLPTCQSAATADVETQPVPLRHFGLSCAHSPLVLAISFSRFRVEGRRPMAPYSEWQFVLLRTCAVRLLLGWTRPPGWLLSLSFFPPGFHMPCLPRRDPSNKLKAWREPGERKGSRQTGAPSRNALVMACVARWGVFEHSAAREFGCLLGLMRVQRFGSAARHTRDLTNAQYSDKQQQKRTRTQGEREEVVLS